MDKKRLIIPIIFLIICISIISIFSYKKEMYEKSPTLSILMMHVVCDEMPEDKSLSGLYITTDMLDRYLEYFKEQNYNVVTLDEAYNIIKNNVPVENNKLLVYTFDDGYMDNYTKGFPILKKHNAKFNLNIIARYTDEQYFNYLTWEQINEMNESGLMELGNHTYDSHIYTEDYKGDSVPILKALLPGESKEQRRERILSDLKKADEYISQRGNYGKKINVMAYPYGVPPRDMQGEIADTLDYYIELMVTPGVNRNINDFTGLHRFIVDGFESPSRLEQRMEVYKGFNFLNKKSRSLRELVKQLIYFNF